MANEETEQILAEIGHLLAEDKSYPVDGTLLYARVGWNMVAPSIFENRGNQIVYRDPDLDRLGRALLDLWDAQKPENRWAEIEYLIRGERFEVSYIYAGEVDPEEDQFDRRDRIVQRYFGDKPIVYPPIADDDGIPQYDL